MKFVKPALLLTLLSTAANAQINAGTQAPITDLPFTMTKVATFNLPWRLVFLPDGRGVREETGLMPRMAMYVICWTLLAQGLSS